MQDSQLQSSTSGTGTSEPPRPSPSIVERVTQLAERLITPELLAAAIARANESFDEKGNLNLHLRRGESAFSGNGMAGFTSRNFSIIAVDMNRNGKMSDANDRVVISAGGSVLVSNVKGDVSELVESPELDARIRALGARINTRNNGNASAISELETVLKNTIRSSSASR